MAEELLHKVDMDWLLTIYGNLLTEKQRTLAALYYEEDFSLSEIAQQQSVSRQSVYDALTRVEKQLRAWEDKLGLRRRFTQIESALDEALRTLPPDAAGARDQVEKALRLLNDEEEQDGL